MSKYKVVIEEFEFKIPMILNSKESKLRMTCTGIKYCQKILLELKESVEQDDFETVADEIHFFKEVKPAVMSYLILFSEIRSCELRKPKAGIDFQVRFYEKEIKKINKFFYRNIDFSHYMELGYTYLDHQLFVRGQEGNLSLAPLMNYYQFPGLSTSHDMVWSKITGMHRFLHYILTSLEELKSPGLFLAPGKKQPQELLWTYSKTALIELIYALYSEGALNNGTVGLTAITSSFEGFFNIKLDNIYKTYSEIKERKGSKAKFLEELKLSLECKISKEDSI